MRAGYLGLWALQALSLAGAAPSAVSIERAHEDISGLAGLAYREAEREAKENELNKRWGERTCSWKDIRVRREW